MATVLTAACPLLLAFALLASEGNILVGWGVGQKKAGPLVDLNEDKERNG